MQKHESAVLDNTVKPSTLSDLFTIRPAKRSVVQTVDNINLHKDFFYFFLKEVSLNGNSKRVIPCRNFLHHKLLIEGLTSFFSVCVCVIYFIN